MPYRVEVVDLDALPSIWPQIGLMLSNALARAYFRPRFAEDGHALLWVVSQSRDIVAALVIHIDTRRRALSVWLMAGRDFDDWIGVVMPLLGRYAREHDLKAVEATVRPGLQRKLLEHGWRTRQVIMRCDNG